MNLESRKKECLLEFLRGSDQHRCLSLDTGLAAFDCRRRLIAEANKSICISTFLWRNDSSGTLLLRELGDKALAGVKVNILLDHWVCMNDQNSILPQLREMAKIEHVRVRLFNPIIRESDLSETEIAFFGLLAANTLHKRMHGKIMLIDNSCAIIGGRNLGDEYFDLHRVRCFVDSELLFSGPTIKDVMGCFQSYWDASVCVDIKDIERERGNSYLTQPPEQEAKDLEFLEELVSKNCPDYTDKAYTPCQLELVSDAPDVDIEAPRNTGQRLESLFKQAKESVHITSPMSIFPESLLKILKQQKNENQDFLLSIVINSLVSSDNLYTYAGGLNQRKELIRQIRTQLHEVYAVPQDIEALVPSYQRLVSERGNENLQPGSGFGSNKYESSELHITLHAKYFVFDKKKTIIGSMNLDPRSLYSNTELYLIIEDDALTKHYLELHNKLRQNVNAWVVAEQESRPFRSYISNLLFRLQKYKIGRIWPFRYSACFAPRKGTKVEIPNPYDDHFSDLYKASGAYPGIDETQEGVEMTFIKHFSYIFRRML